MTTPAQQYIDRHVTAKTKWPIRGRDKTTGEIIISQEFLDTLPQDWHDTRSKPARHALWELLLLWYLTIYRQERRKCPVMESILSRDMKFQATRRKPAPTKGVPGRELPPPRTPREEFIRELMETRGIRSYSELERETGIPRSAIYYFATGKRSLSTDNAIAMARTFGQPLEEFINIINQLQKEETATD